MNTDQFEEDYSDLKMCLSHPKDGLQLHRDRLQVMDWSWTLGTLWLILGTWRGTLVTSRWTLCTRPGDEPYVPVDRVQLPGYGHQVLGEGDESGNKTYVSVDRCRRYLDMGTSHLDIDTSYLELDSKYLPSAGQSPSPHDQNPFSVGYIPYHVGYIPTLVSYIPSPDD